MGTIVKSLDAFAEWLDKDVCEGVELKRPKEGKDTEAYDYELVRPSVFTLYTPTPERPTQTPPAFPSLCVQLIDGEDDMAQKTRTMAVRISFATYDPGIHGPDVFTPIGGCGAQRAYRQGERGTFKPSCDGWRDVWNFVDKVVRRLEEARSVGELEIGPEIKFSPYWFENELPDTFPLWFAKVELSLKTRIRRNSGVEQFL